MSDEVESEDEEGPQEEVQPAEVAAEGGANPRAESQGAKPVAGVPAGPAPPALPDKSKKEGPEPAKPTAAGRGSLAQGFPVEFPRDLDEAAKREEERRSRAAGKQPKRYEAQQGQQYGPYGNVALATSTLAESQKDTLSELDADLIKIKAMKTLMWSDYLDVLEITSKWQGYVGFGIEPSQPDLIKRPVTFAQPAEATEEEGEAAEKQEAAPGRAQGRQHSVLITTKAYPLIMELKVTHLLYYGTLAESIRIISREMEAVAKVAYREWVQSDFAPGYGEYEGIKAIQEELVKRSGTVRLKIKSSYGALIKGLLSNLARVEAFYYSGPAGIAMRGGATIPPLTPGEATEALRRAKG